jgi:hypothetical protein
MIAKWYIGKDCDPREFEKKLEDAPFDCVVLVVSARGLKEHEILQVLEGLGSGCICQCGRRFEAESSVRIVRQHLCRLTPREN